MNFHDPAKLNLKEDINKDAGDVNLNSGPFTGSSSFASNFNFTTGITVQNITVYTHEATKFSRVFELKTLFGNSRVDTSNNCLLIGETAIDVTAKIIKNTKPQTR